MDIDEKVKRQTENAIKYYKNPENIEEVPIDILRAMYKDSLVKNEQYKVRTKELEEKELDYTTVYISSYEDCNIKWANKIQGKIDEIKKDKTHKWTAGTTVIVLQALQELLENKGDKQ